MARLTEAKVRAAKAKPNGDEVVLFDDAVPGLVLRVGRRKKTWRLRVFRRNGEERINVTHPLGSYPPISLDTAREEARRILKTDDPLQLESDGPTLKDAWESYRAARIKKLSTGTIANYERSFHHLAAFHDTPLRALSAKRITDLHTKMTNEGHPAGANGMARFLSAVWHHASRTAGREKPLVWMKITEAGRQVIAE
jgi:hypothetical protein